MISVVGPPEFVEMTKRAVRTFVYEPAMVDGQPIAISHRLRAYFGNETETSARASIIEGYENAAELLKAGKLDEAHAKLTEMFNLPTLNYFERGIIMYPLVLIALQRHQYSEASRLSGLALSFGPGNFSETVYRGMFRSHILASLAMNDIAGAAKYLDRFKKWRRFDSADPLINQVADAQKNWIPCHLLALKPASQMPLMQMAFVCFSIVAILLSPT